MSEQNPAIPDQSGQPAHQNSDGESDHEQNHESSADSPVFNIVINPRFCDTDAIGHINNTVFPVWFLEGREAILKIFNPNLATDDVSIVLAKLEIEYLGEVFFGKQVEVRTYVLRIGTSSVLVGQEVWQEGGLKATATATMVNFDKKTRKSHPIPTDIRKALAEHLLEQDL